jgi:hypothetical protein
MEVKKIAEVLTAEEEDKVLLRALSLGLVIVLLCLLEI